MKSLFDFMLFVGVVTAAMVVVSGLYELVLIIVKKLGWEVEED